MIRTQISLTAEQHEGLTKLADDLATSMSAIVRQAVDHVLAEGDRKVRVDHAIRLARLVGFRSRETDIAREHDRYLDHAFGQ